jgi:8-oxo-dGTP pyrophosphatase MutT (NUDIX family)
MSESKPTLRPASTMLLLRDGAAGMEVFMVVRHHQIDFASGALVFPGGSIDADDHVVAARKDLVAPGLTEAELGFAVGAIRETFEECGMLLARPQGSDALVSAEHVKSLDGTRPVICEGKLAFSELLSAEKLTLATDLLVPYAHWVTPVTMPKRFDTRFFLAVAPSDQVGLHDGTENVDSIWITPQQAVADGEAGRRTVIFPTMLNLLKLARRNDVQSAIAAARASDVVTVMPHMTKVDDGFRMEIPAAADYGGDVFLVQGGALAIKPRPEQPTP